MTNISEDMVNAALAAAYPTIWTRPGTLSAHEVVDGSAGRRDQIRERMVAALEAAVALTPLPERSEEAQDLAIELGRLAARVARLAPVQPASEPPVFTPVPPGHSQEAQLIADFYAEVKTDKMGTVTGFELGALDGRLILVRDELKRLRDLVDGRDRLVDDVRRSAHREIAVLTSRIELLNEEIRSLNRRLTVKAGPAPEAPVTPPPSDDPIEKMFDTVLGWAERGLDAINTKLSDDKKKDE